ncbi:UdgX family uracil-DNA binding protein [Rhodococcoides kroppenstedtii]|uniref:UdgX family uracil-DNA binding protein n=1 Tax=Rhodococcoides kroppenstedtii TaxID=293050 RepID=UPI001427EBE0|nr:UdgX family uracil-DNA binding protein [Rhodococcus kroppenstedtii]NIL80329.1 Type-4 uracil-DNA glycosylase [Rhodococcus kroppenstedtii]
MAKFPGAATFVPDTLDLDDLAMSARECRGCDLWEPAEHVVFGAGSAGARMMLVGEQPGDQEDRRAAPFVGPAGILLNRALAQADIDREVTYVTNAVKHFKFTRGSGPRRIHQKPLRSEVTACHPWLQAELRAVDPEVVVLLGATAAQALMGPSFRIGASRGEVLALADAKAVATVHPSAVLRTDDAERDAAFDGLVADLRVAAGLLT